MQRDAFTENFHEFLAFIPFVPRFFLSSEFYVVERNLHWVFFESFWFFSVRWLVQTISQMDEVMTVFVIEVNK